MNFNLLETGYMTSSGTVSLTVEDMVNILSVSGTVNIYGASNDVLWMDGDIVDRVGTYQIRYYFDSSTSSGTVASGISFYYRDDEQDFYSELATHLADGYYYTTVPGLSAPRYIQVKHDVSGTAISGTVVGLQILNDDTVVDFGSDGSLTSSTTLTSLEYLNYNDYIKEIEIYNNGTSIATAHVFFEPQYNDADDLMSISASENGPWVFARNTDYIISSGDNWDAGQYYQTSITGVADGKLRLNPSFNDGTYTTPIFKNESVTFAYIDVLQTAVSGAIIATDSDDYTSTLQIRSSNTKPINYNVYRTLHPHGYPNAGFWYREWLTATDTQVYDSYSATGTKIGTFVMYQFYHFRIPVDRDTQRSAFFGYYRRIGGTFNQYYEVRIFFADKDGVMLYQGQTLALTTSSSGWGMLNAFLKEILFTADLGVWVYFYCEDNLQSQGYPCKDTGYYLMRLNYGGNLTFNSGVKTSDTVPAFDVVADSNSIWYINVDGSPSVIKLSTTGAVEASYVNVLDPTALCSTDDGGFWLVDSGILYKFDSTPAIERSLELNLDSDVTIVKLDLADSNCLWILEGAYVKRISNLDGRVFSSTYMEDSVYSFEVNTEGVGLYCTDALTGAYVFRFLGRVSGGVTKEIDANSGIRFVEYDNPILGAIIPLADDPVWNSDLEWNKAVTVNAVLPREEYHQLKLTLRRPDGVASPTVENIYYQDNVEISDIYPNNSETLYLKMSIPTGMTVGGDYESMLRVWWSLPIT